jgi:DNA polymerase-3 subunit beta
MTTTVDTRTLADALAWVVQVVPTRPNAPVLAGVRLYASPDTNTMRVAAFDYETAHVAQVSANVEHELNTVVPGHVLRDLVAAMSGASVELRHDDQLMHVTSGRAKYGLATMDPADYPGLPPAGEIVGTVDAQALATAVRAVEYAADPASPKTFARGVLLRAKDSILDVVALDGLRGAWSQCDWQGDDTQLLPDARRLAAAVKGLTGTVTVRVRTDSAGGVSGMALETEDRMVGLAQIAAVFPATWESKAFVTEPQVARADVDTAELKAALRRIIVTGGEDKLKHLRLSITEGELSLTPKDRTETEIIDAETEGTVVLGASAAYLADMLVSGERTTFQMTHPFKPVVVGTPGDPVTQHMIMPVRL